MASISIIITDLLSIIHAARRVKRFFLFYQNKRMNGYSLIAIQLFGQFINGIQ